MKTMPFGKHKDKLLSDLPISYLTRAVEHLDSPEVVAALEKELEKKYDEGDLDLVFQEVRVTARSTGAYVVPIEED
jgi:Putative quorum-sensing-regulated virulence factor